MSRATTAKGLDEEQRTQVAVPISTGESLADLAREVRESVGRRAYDYYEARGREDGQDLADWFRAEDELTPLQEQVSESDGQVRIQASLEGLRGTDLRVGVDTQHVIVTARQGLDQPDGHRTLRMAKVVSLPAEIDPKRASASSDGQTLTIVLPKAGATQTGETRP